MKYSQCRIALLTFIIGLLSVSFLTPLYDKWSEPWVDVPQVETESPLIVILSTDEHPFNMNGGGGGSGGETCEDFIKSLGKLTKQSRQILALTPCYKEIPKE
jgi:hypothetical protein